MSEDKNTGKSTTITDIRIPFWRMVTILMKWSLAAIPVMFVLFLIFGFFFAVFSTMIMTFYNIGVDMLPSFSSSFLPLLLPFA